MVNTLAKKYWNPKLETITRKELLRLQTKKMRSQVQYAYQNTQYYRRKLKSLGLKPDRIRTMDDFRKRIPFLLKDEIRKERDRTGDPFGGFLAVSRDKLISVHGSTGTTGIPTYQAATAEDMAHGAESFARWHYGIGLRRGDIVLSLLFYYHQWTHWMEASYELVGLPVFRRGGLPFEVEADLKQVRLWSMLKPRSIIVTHNPLRLVTNTLRQNDVDPKRIFKGLKVIQTAGDVLTTPLREELEEFWGVPVYEVGGPTDILACTVGLCKMMETGWSHLWEDQWIIEVIDPKTLEPVDPGERGELVYTNLNLKATPYLRWRSEDMVDFRGNECECGRTHASVRLLGRTGQVIQVGEKKICLRDVDESVQKLAQARFLHYQLVKETPQPQSMLVMRTTMEAHGLEEELRIQIKKDLSIDLALEIIQPEELQATGGWKLPRLTERKSS